MFNSVLLYVFASAFSAGANFLILPYLTFRLEPFDMGIIETFIAFNGLFIPIIMLGTTTLINKDYLNIKDFKEKLEKYIGSILLLVLIVFFFLTVIVAISVFLSDFLEQLSQLSVTLIFLVIFNALSNVFIQIRLTLYQINSQAAYFTVFVVSRVAFDLLSSLLLITVLNYNWEGRIGGIVLASTVFSLIAMRSMFKQKFYFFFQEKTLHTFSSMVVH